MKPIISIIIPCYNSGGFLPEALASIEQHPRRTDVEVIIVNDGSTDALTLELLANLSNQGYIIIHQENGGCGAARNTGIRNAKSDYLLFLDCDNKIYPAYIDKGIEVLQQQKEVGVVYGNPKFFGYSTKQRFWPGEYDLLKVVDRNYIDACAVVRKAAWEQLGGFDDNKAIRGHEDWDFWIRVGEAGWKFKYINEVLYEYRLREDSLIVEQQQVNKVREMRRYMFTKHLDLFIASYHELKKNSEFYENDQKKPFRSFLKYVRNKIKKHIKNGNI